MKRYLWTILLTVSMLFLASCGSEEDDKLAGFPWNDKELFSQVFTIDDEGRCLLEGQDAISRQALNINIVGYGWQPVGIYQVMEDGKLSKDDYREKIEGYVPKVYEFLTDEQMKTYYREDDTHQLCFKQQVWSYDDEQGIITRKDKQYPDVMDKYLQVLKVKTSEDATYLYMVEKIGTAPAGNDQVKNIFGLVVYQRLSNYEQEVVRNEYAMDKSEKEDLSKLPDGCTFNIKCSYFRPEEGYEDVHTSFKTFRFLELELTDDKGRNESSNPYYQYYDSIVWSCKGLPDRVVSLVNKPGYHTVSPYLTTYFFNTDQTTYFGEVKKTYLQADGYKDGSVVYSTGTWITLYNEGFLGYDFGSFKLQYPPTDDYDLYCIFDKSKLFQLLSPRLSEKYPEKPYAELSFKVGEWVDPDDTIALITKQEKQKKELANLMDMYYRQYGKGIVVDGSNIEKYRRIFKALPADADIVMYWQDFSPMEWEGYSGSNIALVLEKNKENPQYRQYFIHAEPKN